MSSHSRLKGTKDVGLDDALLISNSHHLMRGYNIDWVVYIHIHTQLFKQQPKHIT